MSMIIHLFGYKAYKIIINGRVWIYNLLQMKYNIQTRLQCTPYAGVPAYGRVSCSGIYDNL